MDLNFSWLFSPIAKLAIAGALGGVVRWLTLKQPALDGLISVVVGGVCAIYIGPAIIPIMRPIIDFGGVDPEAAQGLGGFLVGIAGILRFRLPPQSLAAPPEAAQKRRAAQWSVIPVTAAMLQE